jgi:transcriptional regulator with XRE-family HTH domain
MGQTRRQRPARLATKLKEIRVKLSFTQDQMAKRLHKVKAGLQPGHISEFESGKREPSLLLLLAYARVAGISTDVLIDDKLDLPDVLSKISE